MSADTVQYTTDPAGFRFRKATSTNSVAAAEAPRKHAGIVALTSGEYGSLIGNAVDGFKLSLVFPTYADARRGSTVAASGPSCTKEAIDEELAEEARLEEEAAAILSSWGK